MVCILSTHTTRWCVYVVRCSDGSLYCGVTTDVDRRVAEHNSSRKGARYTRSRRPVKLARVWLADSRSDALRKEAAYKRLRKSDKERLLEQGELP